MEVKAIVKQEETKPTVIESVKEANRALGLTHPAQCWGWYDGKAKECGICLVVEKCEDFTKRIVAQQSKSQPVPQPLPVLMPVFVPVVQNDDVKEAYKRALQTIFHNSGEVLQQ